jgi:hypothetical protein
MKSTRILFLAIIVLACEQPKEKEATPAHQYLEEMTIPQLQVGYQKSTFTIEQVVKDYLQRIEDLDKNGPALKLDYLYKSQGP